MIKKIIFLTISPFNHRDYKRFGVELLERNGFEVEVWDITNIFFPYVSKSYAPSDKINWLNHKVFKDKNHVLNKLENLKPETFIIPFLQYNRRFYSLYKALSRSVAIYGFVCANFQPSVQSAKKGNTGIFLYHLEKLKDPVNKLMNYGFQKLPLSMLGLKPARLLLAGGEKSIKYQAPVNRSTEVLWIHTLDYDLYLEEINKPSSEKHMAVFLDEYLPFHPDFFRTESPPPIKPDQYYPLLNKFFTLTEQQLKLNVIIAAHPRSQYENLSDLFEGREWIQGQTIQLIKDSKLVLAHSSTALNFANLYHKPVIFLTTFELDKSYKGPLIGKVANLFGKKPVYMDRDIQIDWNLEFMVSKFHYENYRQEYIKKEGSEELPFWDIVAHRLKRGL